MSKKFQISLIVLVTVILLLAVTIPGLAKKPDIFFTVEADYVMDWVTLTMEGTKPFTSTGAIQDVGTSWGHWVPQPLGVIGILFFESNKDQDMFVIQWKASTFKPDDDLCAKGTFTINANLGTGEYEGLWGTGTLTACRVEQGSNEIVMTMEGRIP